MNYARIYYWFKGSLLKHAVKAQAEQRGKDKVSIIN